MVLGILIIGLLALAFILGSAPRRLFPTIFSSSSSSWPTPLGEATGLGLAVSYAIVNKYGGSIRFESRAAEDGVEGSTGTTFFVDLQPEYAAAPAPEARRAPK